LIVGFLRRRGTKRSNAGPTDPSIVPIATAPARHLVRVCGQVIRMRTRPTGGLPALAVSISDDSGTAVAVWTGRRSIGAITLGRRLVIEGVAVRSGDHLEFTNPAYTLLEH
jgi:hypothetical protein